MKTYYCNVKPLLNKKTFGLAMNYTDDDWRIKIEKLKNPLDKARSLGCFLLYRYLWIHETKIGKMTEQRGKSIYKSMTLDEILMSDSDGKAVPHINIGKNGKPDIDDIYNVHISFSHSGDIAAVSYYAGESAVGMDIQIMSNRKVKDCVAEFIMSAREFNYYNSDQCNDKCKFFYEVLCCKEAYTKMTGEGIDTYFGKLDISDIKNKYHLDVFALDEEGRKYMLAMCCKIENNVLQPMLRKWSGQER